MGRGDGETGGAMNIERVAARRSRSGWTSLALLLALPFALLTLLATTTAAAAATPPVTISPLPGTPDASPHTQISFLGMPASEISHVSVVGSRSGPHSGLLQPYQSAPGESFLPIYGFSEGERVTVSALVGPSHHQQRIGSSFQIAHLFHYRFPPKAVHKAATSGSSVQSIVSAPSLHPSTVYIGADSPSASAGDVFLAFNEGSAQWGPMIIEGDGQLVWFQPVGSEEHAMDFKTVEYAGRPALLWWQGYIAPIGVGFGQDEIYDEHYRRVAQIKGGNGYYADLHEALLAKQGAAYITAYTLVQASLSSVHGHSNAGLLDSVLQEIDVRTGLVMFEWHAYGHVSLSESYSAPPSSGSWPYDYFHLNSLSLDPSGDGNFLICARNTWAGYEIDHRSGRILWRLGGKHPSFKMGPGTETAFQHDIRWQPDHTITVFDDGASPQVHKQSRVIHERIEWKAKAVKLVGAWAHSPALVAASQGNYQLLPDGNSFVGWGQSPFITEFGRGGTVLFQAQLPGRGDSYRAYRLPWKGMPASPPAVAVHKAGNGTLDVYASWNGATEVASWRVLAWNEIHHVARAGTAARAGFETTIPVPEGYAWYSVQALGPSGKVLATSHATRG
jgi:Arylsulfotransferase (ASST)